MDKHREKFEGVLMLAFKELSPGLPESEYDTLRMWFWRWVRRGEDEAKVNALVDEADARWGDTGWREGVKRVAAEYLEWRKKGDEPRAGGNA